MSQQLEAVARAAYAAFCACDPIEAREPNWGRGGYKTEVVVWQAVARAAITALSQPVPSEPTEAMILADIAAMMGEFVDNWPEPKRVKTALALIAKTIRAMLAAGENSDAR